MTDKNPTIGSSVSLPKSELDNLLANLRKMGFQTIGPCLQDESIVYKGVQGLKDLPQGIQSEQLPSSYRLIQSGKPRYFDFIPGSHSWKQLLFPPRHTLFTVVKDGSWQFKENEDQEQSYALIGVRACELAAIHVQDKVFLRSDFSDPVYRKRREGLFILAVNCLDPDATCFCTSMGTGPKHTTGFDLCITELDEVFLVEIGSELGRSLIADRNFDFPSAFVQTAANQAIEHANESILRRLDTSDLPGLLMENLDADQWTDVGKRCLACANCTQVCPTCFCWDATDRVDILGKSSVRERIWDSCFNPKFSYVVGGNTRPNIRSRYRQWLTHKLGAWQGQFGVLGCVGCGRCITWCPAGIDLIAEVEAIRAEVKA